MGNVVLLLFIFLCFGFETWSLGLKKEKNRVWEMWPDLHLLLVGSDGGRSVKGWRNSALRGWEWCRFPIAFPVLGQGLVAERERSRELPPGSAEGGGEERVVFYWVSC